MEFRLVPTDGTRFGVWFRPVSEEKVGRNRIHLDLATTSRDDQDGTVAGLIEAEVDRLVSLGATRTHEHGAGSVVMADPEGNEFRVSRSSS